MDTEALKQRIWQRLCLVRVPCSACKGTGRTCYECEENGARIAEYGGCDVCDNKGFLVPPLKKSMNKEELVQSALAARENAYVPYSHYKVGAAVQTGDGRTFAGCNVENSSYGLCNCAERTAIFTAVANGAKEIVAVAVVTEDGGTPCGACRQVMAEFAPRDDSPLVVLLADGMGTIVRETTLAELFPLAFTLR